MPVKQDSAKPYSNSQSPQNTPAASRLAQPKSSLSMPSCGELERSVGQALQRSYRQHLGHLPTRVSCHLFANKLSVWIEGSLTPVEHILFASSASSEHHAPFSSSQTAQHLARQPDRQPDKQPDRQSEEEPFAKERPKANYFQEVRFAIDQAMQQRLSKVVEDCLGVSVITIISGTCYEQNCTSLAVLLSDTPAVRNPDRIPKTAASRQSNRKLAVKAGTDS